MLAGGLPQAGLLLPSARMCEWPHGLERWTCYCPSGHGQCSYKQAQQDYRWTKEDAISKLAHHLVGAQWHKVNERMCWKDAQEIAEATEMVRYLYDSEDGWLSEEEWMVGE